MEDNIVKTFYSDASHNYMVIECPHELRDNYQYKMLAANQIRGLLPCSSRSIDNQEYLYYDITSRQSMEDLFDRRPVRGKDVEKLLEDLFRVEKTLTEYLLDTSHMILDPSCIYVDFSENESSFVYYPGAMGEAGWAGLFNFLADRIDGKDKRAAALVYRLCMMAEKPGFRLKEETLEEMGIRTGRKKKGSGGAAIYDPADIQYNRIYPSEWTRESDAGDALTADRGIFRPEYGSERSAGQSLKRGKTTGAGAGFALQGFEETGRGTFGTDNSWREVEKGGYAGNEGEGEGDAQRERNRIKFRRNVVFYLFSFLMIAAGAGLALLHRLMPLGEREMILSLAAGAIMVLTGIVLSAVHAFQGFQAASKERAVAGQNPESGYTDSGENIDELEEFIFESGAIRDPGRRISGPEDLSVPLVRGTKEEAGSYSPAIAGETSVLGGTTGKPLALYGTGTCRGEKISLADLPCVVGKMRTYVDQVLDDSSVSRMHARFSADHDGKMTVRDLNSTNGTWLNGERLMPNESRVMREGDHVRLGRMEFVFR